MGFKSCALYVGNINGFGDRIGNTFVYTLANYELNEVNGVYVAGISSLRAAMNCLAALQSLSENSPGLQASTDVEKALVFQYIEWNQRFLQSKSDKAEQKKQLRILSTDLQNRTYLTGFAIKAVDFLIADSIKESLEIIDFKLLRTIRVENAKLGTIDYVHPDGTVVFRTSAEEKGKVILQLGTADARRALQAAKHV
ncbi:unnamed protein product [Dibothriocephalus latus]|uniref:Uncharacterized protein n=1 Tax=Dibothriocephalus latus TaxID=60516 RepID=A0A3P6NTL0_DIBLA|nr:unnamed protein product [Dibothriocephalus latus]